MSWMRLSAIDAWFFRDGRPYTQGEADQSDVTSLFPPSPSTVAGALRAAIARGNGWDGRPGQWTGEHHAVLGIEPEDCGMLSFRGPFLSCRSDLLLPAPLHVLARGKGEQRRFALLAPGDPVECDLGEALRLPEIADADHEHTDWKSLHGSFITASGLRRVCSGQVPKLEDVVAAPDLWQLEYRTALQRDTAKHTTGDEGDLYSPAYIRTERDVGLVVEVRGLPRGWEWPDLLPLGGEGRMASAEPAEETHFYLTSDAAALTDRGPRCEFIVVCLTPLRLPLRNDVPVTPDRGTDFFEALGVRGVDLISACVDRPVHFGGWDSLASSPLPLRPCLPAGSTLFCTAADRVRDDLHAICLRIWDRRPPRL